MREWTEKQIPHAVAYMRKVCTALGAVHRLHIRKQNERCIVSTPLTWNWRFRDMGKSKKRILDRGFLPSDAAKLVQGEWKSKSQRKKVEKHVYIPSLSEARFNKIKFICIFPSRSWIYNLILNYECLINFALPVSFVKQCERSEIFVSQVQK